MRNFILITLLFMFSGFVLAQTETKLIESDQEITLQATINGENILSIKKGDLTSYEIEAGKIVKAGIEDEKGNTILNDFKVLADVVTFKLKIPGQPSKSIHGNKVDLQKYLNEIEPNKSIYIFDIVAHSPVQKDNIKTVFRLNPIVIDVL